MGITRTDPTQGRKLSSLLPSIANLTHRLKIRQAIDIT